LELSDVTYSSCIITCYIDNSNVPINGGRINCQIIGWEMFWKIKTGDI